jgi:seryl-tRNA synthetase
MKQMEGDLLSLLLENGVALESVTPGVVIWSGAFCDLVDRIDRTLSCMRPSGGYESFRPPPVMSRADFERSGYLYHFPQLAGTVHAFSGGEAEHDQLLQLLRLGDDWTENQSPTRTVMTPAACYPIYPMLSRRGYLLQDDYLADVKSYCFRHEPSCDPFRLQAFQMREFVCVASPASTVTFLGDWKRRALLLSSELLLPGGLEPANDAFFGRKGALVRQLQSSDGSKDELVIAPGQGIRVACASFNYHQETFTRKWGIGLKDGAIAESACVGFGLERLALCLYVRYGVPHTEWPVEVRAKLGFDV